MLTQRTPGLLMALTLTGLAVMARPAHAQDVIPPANATTYGNIATIIPLADYPFTFQIDYDASQLSAISPGSDITSLGFRVASGEPTNPLLTFTGYNIELSTSNNPVGSLSTTFADNIGADATTVYNAPLTVAAGALVPGSGVTPGPFYNISFTTPYLYNGGDLLITLRSAGNSNGHSVYLDANSVSSGEADTVAAVDQPGDDTATSGAAEFYNYPIISLGVQSAAITTTPEPASYAVFAMGGFGLLGLGLKSRKRSA